MSILIDRVRIYGFRGIRKLDIDLPKVTVLIGVNNSGKTSLLRALQLSLGDYSRYLSEEDFHIDKDEKRVPEIIVDVRIVPIDENGIRIQSFNEEWQTELGDTIKAQATGHQYVALRTRSKPNVIKGGFDTTRMTLEKWPDSSDWELERVKESKFGTNFKNMPYIFIDAQRDIHQELREKSSFVGKVLSSVEYNPDDISTLESLIKQVNDQSVEKSVALKGLKTHLEKLNQSFQSSGNAEITPFPKKIRDLSKHFTVHFGDNPNSSFSMEYHGMGTRSWASMLSTKAFIDMMSDNHKDEEEPFFPILAVEEPEAHLHPSAQKTLYKQLSNLNGQIIISTHSPYLSAMAEQQELRHLKIISNEVEVKKLSSGLGREDKRRLQQEVIHSRGEIIFSKALVLCEGESEEQALPLLYKKYFGCEAFEMGVNFIGVNGSGKKYLPFLTFAKDFNIPCFIFSDGEDNTVKQLEKIYKKIYGETDIRNNQNITILDGSDFEGYLISKGFKTIIEDAIKENDGPEAITNWITKRHGTLKRREKTREPLCKTCNQPIFKDIFRDYEGTEGYDNALMDILDSAKPKYALAVAMKLEDLEIEDFPEKILEIFNKIEKEVFL